MYFLMRSVVGEEHVGVNPNFWPTKNPKGRSGFGVETLSVSGNLFQ